MGCESRRSQRRFRRRTEAGRLIFVAGETDGGICDSCCSTAHAGSSSTQGLGLMLLGLAVGVWRLPVPRTGPGIHFDIHTLLFGFVIIEFQMANFAVFTKVFAISEGLLPEDPALKRLLRFASLGRTCNWRRASAGRAGRDGFHDNQLGRARVWES
jgi:hypothetical protein